jgi:hypothetical protein
MSEPETSRSRDKRESVMLRAIVWTRSAHAPTEHRVRNLSVSGARLDQAHHFICSEALRVSIGFLTDIPARVVWVDAESAGIYFEKRIDIAAAHRRGTPPSAARPDWSDSAVA